MAVFKCGGREWVISLDGPKVRAVRSHCGVNLAVGPNEPFDVRAIVDDPVTLPDVLWELVKQQAPAAMTADAFSELVRGDVAEEAGLALAEAIVDFIPSRTRREAIREAWKQDREAEMTGIELAVEKMRSVQGKVRETLAAQISQVVDEHLATLSRSVIASPAASGSRPKDELGAS